jgi:hypothetical protein
LTFYPPKKVAPPLIRVEEKNLFQIGHAGYQKKQNSMLISKMCRSLVFGKREKQFYRKTKLLRTWKFLQKTFFLKKNLWELFDSGVLHNFEISAKFCFF